VFVLGLAAVGAAGAGINANWSEHLTGAEEVPPRATKAQGQAILHLSRDSQSLDYRLIATNIENVVAAHIHIGAPDVNGPVVAFLYGPAAPGGGRQTGVLATGTIDAADLTGPLAGASFSDLVAALRSGDAYVNVHTNDGIAPTDTGPGDFPGGEIRAQLVE
jgi:hypothetical protein